MAVVVFLALAAAGCQQAPPPAAPVPTQPGQVTTVPPTPAAPPSTSLPTPVPAPKVALPSLDFLPGPIYFCAAEGGRTPIVYEERVDSLCRRHPEMGPCQYERNACRAKGGRVFTARGEEVTMVVEAEYDRVVRRVVFRADGGEAPKKK